MPTTISITEDDNKAIKTPVEIVGIKAGLITFFALVTYFIFLKYSNLLHSEIAWIFNIFILGAGIMLTYRYYRKSTKLNMDYFPGLILGITLTAASVALFAMFMFFWLSQIDPALLEVLKSNSLFMGGERITPIKSVASIIVEGGSSGLIITFMLLQYYKSGFHRKGKEKLVQG